MTEREFIQHFVLSQDIQLSTAETSIETLVQSATRVYQLIAVFHGNIVASRGDPLRENASI